MFQAKTGDSLHIVASDNNGGACYSVGGQAAGEGLTLVNIAGETEVLSPLINVCDGVNRGPSPYIFFDQTVVIGI
jgi:hypothetical protein